VVQIDSKTNELPWMTFIHFSPGSRQLAKSLVSLLQPKDLKFGYQGLFRVLEKEYCPLDRGTEKGL
jgi:hypothetical protein